MFVADELLEFGWGDFAQALEARDLAVLPSLRRRRVALGLAVTINGLLLVAHAEERRFQHVQMAVMHQLVEEPEEIGDQQIADVQAVHVRVGGQDDFFVAQALDVVLDVQAAHEVVHLVVFINDVALEVPDVERLAFEHENGLGVDVAATDDRSRRPTGLRSGRSSSRCPCPWPCRNEFCSP